MVSQVAPLLIPGSRIRMPYDAFLALDPVENTRVEWVNGEAIVYMAPLMRHNELMMFLVRLLGGFLAIGNRGRVFAAELAMDIPSRPAIRLPDVLVVLNEHRDRLTRKGLSGPADIIFELTSEDSVTIDHRDKLHDYEGAGVPEYIPLDARPGHHQCAFYRLDARGRYQPVLPDDRGRYHSDVLPGFWFDPQWFWQDPLPVVERLLFKIAGDVYLQWLLQIREIPERP